MHWAIFPNKLYYKHGLTSAIANIIVFHLPQYITVLFNTSEHKPTYTTLVPSMKDIHYEEQSLPQTLGSQAEDMVKACLQPTFHVLREPTEPSSTNMS